MIEEPVPVKIPVKVPVEVEVPVAQEYTTVVPIVKTVYKEVPQYIKQTKVITEQVPTVHVVQVPEYHERRVEVEQPYKVIDQINVVQHCQPKPVETCCQSDC